jgi:hypothetical protein
VDGRALFGRHRRRWRDPSGARGRQGKAQDGRCADASVLAAALWNAGEAPEAAGDRLMVERARKLRNYFTQPFFVAEPYTHRPGTYVGRDEALRTCRDILEGRHDEIPAKGGIEEIRNRAAAAQ